MKSWIKATVAVAISTSLLSACQRNNDDTQKTLAALQAQLAAQEKKEAQRQEQLREQERRQQQEERENQIYEQARQDAEAELKSKLEQDKAQQQAAKKKQQSEKQTKSSAVKEKLASYPAFVVTEAAGVLTLRGSPATSGLKVSELYNGEPVTVIAETNVCQDMKNTYGCWVKVRTQNNNITGYVFNGYLQKGKPPAAHEYDEYADDI